MRKRVISSPVTEIGARGRAGYLPLSMLENRWTWSRDTRDARRCHPSKWIPVSPNAPLRSEVSGVTDDLAQTPIAEPNPAPHFYDGSLRKELHMLCKQHGRHNRDERPLSITRLLAMDQMARKRARADTEDETPSSGDIACCPCCERGSCETTRPIAGVGDEGQLGSATRCSRGRRLFGHLCLVGRSSLSNSR